MEGVKYEDFACCNIGKDVPSDSCPERNEAVLLQQSSNLGSGAIVGIIVAVALILCCVCCICRIIIKSIAQTIDDERQCQRNKQ